MSSTPTEPIIHHKTRAETAAHYAAVLAEAQREDEMVKLWEVIERLSRRVTLLEHPPERIPERLSDQTARVRQVLEGRP